MKAALAAGLLGLGALAVVFLGLSMLAASETTMRAEEATTDLRLVVDAEARAVGSAVAGGGEGIPCVPMAKATDVARSKSVISFSFPLTLMTPADTVREARCLHRQGLISLSELAATTATAKRAVSLRHGFARIVPLSLQVVPSMSALTIWSALLAVELVGALLLVRNVRRR